MSKIVEKWWMISFPHKVPLTENLHS